MTEPADDPTRSGRRGRGAAKGLRRALAALLTVGLLVLLMLAAVMTNRPRWRTYTFPVDPKTGMAVVVDYPESWRFNDQPFNDQPSFNDQHSRAKFESSMRLNLQPIPPTGITRWMQEKLLRQDVNNDANDQLSVDVASGESYQSMATLEKQVSSLRWPGITYTFDHRHHVLGPALYVNFNLNMQGLTNQRSRGGTLQGRGMMIYPDATFSPTRMMISIGASTSKSHFARFGAAVDQMIPRVRMIRVTGNSRR